jgi:formamidopyrimidine-DNA glycosylase
VQQRLVQQRGLDRGPAALEELREVILGDGQRLRARLIEVLRHAIQLGGSSVSDYVDADGVRGFFQLEHKVYGRAGEDCRDCGSGLKKIVVGGRTTVYCPKCQR